MAGSRLLILLLLAGALFLAGAIGRVTAQTLERGVLVQEAELTRYPLVAPYVTFGLKRVELVGDYVRVHLPGARFGSLSGDSNLPVHGTGSVVVFVNATPVDIHVGDFVIFRWCGLSNPTGTLIMHQVVKIGKDDKGWFATTKGVNAIRDLCPVRESELVGRAVAVFW